MNVGFQFTVEVMPTCVLYCTVLYCTVLYCTVGYADLRAGPGHRARQRHVHDLADGLALHRLLGQYRSLVCIASHLYSPLLQAVWSEKAPFLITGLLSLLGAVPGLFLPETADLKMPDTLEVSLRIAHCYPHTVLYYLPSESGRTSRSSAGTTGCSGCRCAGGGGGSGAA